jgi:hypothetical protein
LGFEIPNYEPINIPTAPAADAPAAPEGGATNG